MPEEKVQTGRLWLWLGAGVFIILVFFATRYLTRDRLPVREVRAMHRELINTISNNGLVEPETNYEAYSPIATTVVAVYVQPGDVVPAGKVLMQLDDTQARARVATAESAVKAAQAAVEAVTHNGTQQERQAEAADIARAILERDQARHDLAALTKLKSTGAASPAEVAAAQQRLDSAQDSLHASQQTSSNRYSPAEVERAQAELTDAQANLAVARDVLAKTAPRAEVAGTVYSVDAERTEFVEEGKLLLQYADLRHERVRAYFDEPDIGLLAVGQKIQIKWVAKPNRVWQGHIIRTPVTVITYGSRTVGEVLVQVDDPDTELLPKTNVTVTVTTSSQENALSVPREALHVENGKPYVYKVVDQKTLVRTPVTIGVPNLTQAPILSGLNEGDWVATGTTNGLPLQEGIPIKAVP